MIKALAIKELRETWGLAAVALGIYLALVSNLMGMQLFTWIPLMPMGQEVPFAGTEFTSFFAFISVILALALGLRQSSWETSQGTYLFLLHRPIQRSATLGAKLATGIALMLLCAAVPILLYGWWAAKPGTHPSPFEWAMTGHAWRLWCVLPLVYLGAFLSGLRPGHWGGTRLMPLAASGVVTVAAAFVPWWWALGLPLTLVSYAGLIVCIDSVAKTRDYA